MPSRRASASRFRTRNIHALWRADGSYFGFRIDDDIFDYDGRQVGHLLFNEVFGCDGQYLGERRGVRLFRDASKRPFAAHGCGPRTLKGISSRLAPFEPMMLPPGCVDFPSPEEI
jgi:hypothetical protein